MRERAVRVMVESGHTMSSFSESTLSVALAVQAFSRIYTARA